MKKIIFVAMVLICAFATSFAQSKTPTAVTTVFNQKFPYATNVKWDKESAHNYEASFVWKGVNYAANFSDTGEWLETETPTTFNQLPEKVQTAFNTSHKGVTPKAVSKIETSKQGTIYEVEFKQGVKTVEVFYKADGTETKE
ncbi:MAG: PepSY-like domain-containing protein [Bacteroidetes bacterium]|nr:PepSY-like domain-containing protein [Bacteroidota bacterium]